MNDLADPVELTDPDAPHTFEAMVRETVLKAAQIRAVKDARKIHDVAREILRLASKRAEPSPDAVAHPASRPSNVPRKRLRVNFRAGEHLIIMNRIRLSGQSMTSALEAGLEQYARTGQFK